jgi:hypothetical protein
MNLFEEADIIYSQVTEYQGPFIVHKNNVRGTLALFFDYRLLSSFLTPGLLYPVLLGKRRIKNRWFIFEKNLQTIEEYRAYKGWTTFTEGRGWH